MDELVISWKDYRIRNSVVLGSENYIHDLEKNIIYLSKNQVLKEGKKATIYGDGRIRYKGKEYIIKEDEVIVINEELEKYKEDVFVKKFL